MAPTRRVSIARAAALLVLLLGACAVPRDSGVHPAWPPPPAAPRVRHVMSIEGAADLYRPSFWDRLADLVGGAPDQALLRPHSVAVSERGDLYVTDQERQLVHRLHLDGSHASFIEKAGKQFFVSPLGVADCGDLLAVSDSALKEVYLFDQKGKLVRGIEKPGGWGRPTGLAWDAGGIL